MEIWKDIPGYEGLYEASTKGQIRTKVNKVTYRMLDGESQRRVWKSRVLKEKNANGSSGRRDKRYTLWENGKPKTYLGHRLIAITYIPNPNKKPAINHKNGDFRDNRVENLEWVTYKENATHAFENRLIKTADPIVLFNLKSKDSHFFLSMAKASKFLGKNPGYISALLKRGVKEVEGFLIFRN